MTKKKEEEERKRKKNTSAPSRGDVPSDAALGAQNRNSERPRVRKCSGR